MHTHAPHSLAPWQHDHRFGLHVQARTERSALLVALISAVTMAAEIAGGLITGSMALLADGLHMGSHTLALGLSAFAYVWMRRHAGKDSYALGTGKISALSGNIGALLLIVPAVSMTWESIGRLIEPHAIDFSWALTIAVVGLLVNAGCALILQQREHRHEDGHEQGHHHGAHHRHGDHNLRSAYLHVIADAATSVLAIVALLGGAYWGYLWFDPAIGLVGAALVLVWGGGLLRDSSAILLDRSAPREVLDRVRQAIEQKDDNRLADFHVWSIGPGFYAAALSVVTHHPKSADYYRALIPHDAGIRHATIEVHSCAAE